MSSYPAHASPALPPLASPAERPHDLRLDHAHAAQHGGHGHGQPPIVTPSFTPPLTPNGTHPDLTSIPILSPQKPNHSNHETHTLNKAASHEYAETQTQSAPKLIEELPEVWCEVRARIPTTTGQEMFLHLYHNNVDNKEHLAIVFGPHIRSHSLDAPREGETERDRMIRGAYSGTLFPGRTSSRIDAIKREEGIVPRPQFQRSTHASQIGNSAHAESILNGDSPKSDASAQEGIQVDSREKLGPPLVRIHSECYTGETVWSARCDCGEQLDEAARLMSGLTTDPDAEPPANTTTTNGENDATKHDRHLEHHSKFDGLPSLGGVIIYLRQEGRGIGLQAKLMAYNLQDLGADTMQANIMLRHPADARSYGLATAMLLDLGLGGEKGIRLLTNNPDKVRAVEGPGREVRVVERVPMIPLAWRTGGKEGVRGKEVEKYISTKIEKFKHMFSE